MSIANRPRRVVTRTVAMAVTCLTLAGLLAWSPQPATGWNQGSAESTLWQLLNGARVNNGRAPLQQHGTLVALARWRSKDMIERNYFSHTIAGCGCEVYRYYDSNGLSYVWGGENIGWNNGMSDAQSPVSIHEGFMASAGHRSNVLEPSWTHGGVGAFGADNINYLGKVRSPRMYTELFMQARAAAPPPPPPPSSAPPPPSGSGSAPAPAPRPATGGGAPVATATPEPEPQAMHVDKPQRPQPSEPLTGGDVVVPAAGADGVGIADLSADPKLLEAPVPAEHMSLRVEAAPPAERGFVETVLGSLLGWLLG